MKNKEPLAFKFRKYTGQNPFTYSQARDYPLLKLNSEFVPTSKFWNRFNVSNEILIGTRGSGKTILLRMMTYTSVLNLFKGSNGTKVKEKLIGKDVQYIGFYVPLRLRVLNEIGETDDEVEERRRFSFLFNCVSAGSVINEVISILQHSYEDDFERLSKEREVIDKLVQAWNIKKDGKTTTLISLQEKIDRLFDKVREDWDFKKGHHVFDSALLEPIISVIPLLDNVLGFEKNKTTWIACFDEAEYLNKNLQRVLNTVMRSESRGLAIKVATLPFRYNEFRTETDHEYVQPEGDDFRFESIDYSWDENDFVELTDHLVTTRLANTGLIEEFPDTNALISFVGDNSEKDLISIFRNIFSDVSDAEIDKQVGIELQKENNQKSGTYSLGQIKRYKPIYLLRELYKKSRQGNSKVPRLSGEIMIRRVSDGNVRRFIQICDTLFEASRTQFLRPNQQHEAVWTFSKQRHARSKSVYREGFLLHEFLESISNYLFEKLHNGPLMDVGVEFTVTDSLLKNKQIKSALEMGVAYSYFLCPEQDLFYGISKSTKFRLSNATAAYKWLPMRAGAGILISPKSEIIANLSNSEVLRPEIIKKLPINMELDF